MTDCESFKLKSRLSNNTNNAGIANIQITPLLKYLSIPFFEKPLINCGINLMLTLTANCIIYKANRSITF